MNEREKTIFGDVTIFSYFTIPLQRFCINKYMGNYLIIYSGDIVFFKKSSLIIISQSLTLKVAFKCSI